MKLPIKAAMAAICLLATPAAADTFPIFSSGNWSAFSGTVDTGEPVCGIVTAGKNKAFALKWLDGDDRLIVHLYDDSWVTSPGAMVPVIITFGDHSPWSTNAKAVRQDDGHVILEAYVKTDHSISEFITEIENSNEMRISFPSLMRPDWVGGLAGSGAVVRAMVKCILYMGSTYDPRSHL